MKWLICFLFVTSLAEPLYKRQGVQELLSSIDTADKAFLRTTAIIEQRTQFGRLVLLMCRKNCPRLRSLIPQWVRDINEDREYHGTEIIGYHYYTYKKPLPFLNESQIEQFPALVYFIAQTPTYFSGNITSRQSVSRWLVALDQLKVEMPQNDTSLDQLISSSSNCSEKFLVFISDERRCPLQYWNNVASEATLATVGCGMTVLFHNSMNSIVQHKQSPVWTAHMYTGVQPVFLSAPLPAAMSVVLYKRLSLLDESTCRQMFLIHQLSYSILFQDYTPHAVWELIDILIPNATEEECPPLRDTMWTSIDSPLTELQLIYLSGEHDLVKLENKQSYVLVGLTGGIAVIALAVSIFWGLNGSAFAN